MSDLITQIPANDTVQVVGGFVVIIGGFLAVAKIMLSGSIRERESDRKERLHLSEAINRMAESSNKVAEVTKVGMTNLTKATTKSADEAKLRNGHLADLIVGQAEMVQKIADQATDNIITGISTQHIDKQLVDKQIVKDKK